MAQAEVLDLDQLMRVASVGVYEAAKRADIAPSNWSRWRNQGVSPNMSKFSKMKVAVIELAIERESLPIDCAGKTVAELIELAKEWKS